jgi:hypothetical protein
MGESVLVIDSPLDARVDGNLEGGKLISDTDTPDLFKKKRLLFDGTSGWL